MFDPLDLYTPEEPPKDIHVVLERRQLLENEKSEDNILESYSNGDDEDYSMLSPLQVLDLPPPQTTPADILETTLILLGPSTQLNFNNEVPSIDRSEVTTEQLDELCHWNIINKPYSYLTTKDSLLTRLPSLSTQCSSGSPVKLLSYYTSILHRCENNPELTQLSTIVAKRIAELCGRTAQPSMTRDFRINNLEKTIKLYEPALTSDNLGHKTWGSSLVLANRIPTLENCSGSSKPRVLELGSGTGLVGITYTISHSNEFSQVFLTDLPEIVPNLRTNAKLNDLSTHNSVIADVLDWTNHDSFVEKYGDIQFDIILIADPIYSPQHPIWLMDTVKRFLKKNGEVHLELPIRTKYNKERETLWRIIEEKGLEVLEEDYEQGIDDWGQVEYIYKRLAYPSTN
ncbi:hypothetical protein TBLA_0D05200 [Henningerozyma blattae CBS 6284]|uniref:FAM86 N-terminal domain-containing protein n=1 Tax=Henningerozyma blattae (strain ATCC 34711 / CBS 6284 / DSM 70876 / NBRC 10599 / NRRL Y-10934 / UCD 77-7) TaxID=1071380 RepID=I2H3R1_HENB6|nr:hypothetical protein TBLA_0D05200 [Tetrapisispora blattae CBS 6284]CCH61013.1 hypothetical protein TBLA_0D05200 [Tetrapisispora blattae CBS 6284]